MKQNENKERVIAERFVDAELIFVLQRQHSQLDQYWEGPSMSLCRLYEIGRQRGESSSLAFSRRSSLNRENDSEN